MSRGDDITTKFKFDISELKSGITESNRLIRLLNSEFKLATSGMEQWASSTEGLNAKLKQLNSVKVEQTKKLDNYKKQLQLAQKAETESKTKVDELRKKYQEAVVQYGENSKEAKAYATQLKLAEKEHQSNAKASEELQIKLNNQQGVVNKTTAEIEKYEKSLAEVETESAKLNETVVSQEKQLKELQDQYKNLVLEQKEGTDEAKSLKEEIVTLSSELQTNKDKLNEAEKATSSLSEAFEESNENAGQLNDGFTVLGGTIANVLGAAIISVTKKIKDGVKEWTQAGIDFESSITTVKKVTEGTEEELQKVADGIRATALEFPVLTGELSELAAAGGRLGIHAKDVNEFAETVAHLGNVSDFAGDAAATMMARFENVTDMGQDKFSNLGSTIVALGNNSAATEKEIMNLGMNIAAAGSQVGMSEGDILGFAAALSSVGLEAAGGGTAFSRMLVDIQLATETGGKELDNFAKVAGMSAQEFKRAFQEDAAGAMMAFISGLANAEDQGISTIAMLDSLGVNQVQMRDTFLRAANASDLMNDSVARGNEAFEKNTELMYVANQRYSTTESQIQVMKNGVHDLAIGFSNALIPSIQDVVVEFTAWANNNEGEKAIQNIAEATAVLIKIFGAMAKFVASNAKLITGAIAGMVAGWTTYNAIIKTSTAISKSYQVVASLFPGIFAKKTAAVNAATVAQKGLNTAQAMSPAGALALVVGGLVTALTALVVWTNKSSAAADEEIAKQKQLTAAVEESIEKRKKAVEAREEAVAAGFSEMEHIRKLKVELDQLARAEGELTEAQRNRANFIITELNTALGTEIEFNDILNGSYLEQSLNINHLIHKKKNMILMEQLEIGYREAIMNKDREMQELTQLGMQLQKEELELAELKATKTEGFSDAKKAQLHGEIATLETNVAETQRLYDEKNGVVEGYFNDITMYETGAVLAASDNADDWYKLNDMVANSHRVKTDDVVGDLKRQLEETDQTMEWLWQMYNETGDRIYLTERESQRKRREELQKSLEEQVSTVRGNIDANMEAFTEFADGGTKALKKSGEDNYNAALYSAQNAVAGALDVKETYAELGRMYGDDFVKELRTRYPDVRKSGTQYVEELQDAIRRNGAPRILAVDYSAGYEEGIVSRESLERVTRAGTRLAEAASRGTQIGQNSNSPSKVAMQLGFDFVDGYIEGMKRKAAKAASTAKNIAAEALSALNTNADVFDTGDGGVLTNGFAGMIKQIEAYDTNVITRSMPSIDVGGLQGNLQGIQKMSAMKQQSIPTTQQQTIQNISTTQNNYSPKALSRKEIYLYQKQQTKFMAALIKQKG